jgi:hypothetical protein
MTSSLNGDPNTSTTRYAMREHFKCSPDRQYRVARRESKPSPEPYGKPPKHRPKMRCRAGLVRLHLARSSHITTTTLAGPVKNCRQMAQAAMMETRLHPPVRAYLETVE